MEVGEATKKVAEVEIEQIVVDIQIKKLGGDKKRVKRNL